MKTFLIFSAVAFAIIYSVVGVKESYVVGNRSSGLTSTLPILVVASFVIGAFMTVWFKEVVNRLSRSPKKDEDV